jgi:DnaD/phage-associated family protein
MDDGYALCLNKWALDEDIKNELGLLIIISSLTAEKGYCFASNNHLAKLFHTNETLISRKIKKLEQKDYITIEYEKRGTQITSRKIRLSKTIMDRYRKKQWTVIENDKDNNTSINNTSINNTATDSIFDFLQENGFQLSPIQYEVVKEWEDNELTRHAIKKAVLNNAYRISYIQSILNSYKRENIKTVQQAMESDEEFNNKKDNYYKNKYSLKENRHDREKRVMEEFLKNDKDRSNETTK